MESYGAVTGASVPLGAQEWPARTVPVSGVDLLVRDVPGASKDLPPALFVHGLGGSSLNWTTIGLLLSDTVRGIAPDLPGFGRTPPLPGLGGLTRQVDVLDELVDREIDEPVHLFGNSMGGAAAVAFAARRPDRVKSLTLISPALPHPRASAVSLWFLALATPRLGEVVLDRSRRLPFDRRLRVSLTMVYGDPAALAPETLEAHAAELRRRDAEAWYPQATVEGARSILRAYLTPPRRSLWAAAAKVRCPVLLVYGGRDRLVDARIRTKAQSTFPDARLLYLPNSGHVAQMEHPQEVEQAFRQLIR
ncbi:pimeloyl-ACP methyl ester carboxylesterase [Kribbella orskensis]|uniref:Pimeloyl-ACP methyl ester carboxylesterase n=1 Tax=Kribbella orskensis TaxID=2512216 RepID=A0ABY2BC34_9ACTN|nr:MULTISPECIES: alpha/beta hydrolase [Kribbella]TCN34897.1 pimeloyl-ACP methyl ester carboxylesterase [Kribbella sp. VKM Ac-2500]TCO15603.1 pimeloyl-ACP methyl ester carboxylesterase [Kribbella orskensis]